MEYCAALEGSNDVDRPDRDDLIDLIDALEPHANSFFIVYPIDDDLEWSYAASKDNSAFGGFELDRYDPALSEHATTITAADPSTIADDILTWINHR